MNISTMVKMIFLFSFLVESSASFAKEFMTSFSSIKVKTSLSSNLVQDKKNSPRKQQECIVHHIHPWMDMTTKSCADLYFHKKKVHDFDEAQNDRYLGMIKPLKQNNLFDLNFQKFDFGFSDLKFSLNYSKVWENFEQVFYDQFEIVFLVKENTVQDDINEFLNIDDHLVCDERCRITSQLLNAQKGHDSADFTVENNQIILKSWGDVQYSQLDNQKKILISLSDFLKNHDLYELKVGTGVFIQEEVSEKLKLMGLVSGIEYQQKLDNNNNEDMKVFAVITPVENQINVSEKKLVNFDVQEGSYQSNQILLSAISKQVLDVQQKKIANHLLKDLTVVKRLSQILKLKIELENFEQQLIKRLKFSSYRKSLVRQQEKSISSIKNY